MGRHLWLGIQVFPGTELRQGGGGANVLGPLNSAAKGLSARVSTLPVFIRK